MLLFYYYGREIFSLLTDIEEVVDTAMSCIVWYMINLIPDSARGQLRGVIKGLGLQSEIIMIHLLCQGIFSVFLTWQLAFKMELGLSGIWISKIIGDSIVTLYYIYLLYSADWR